MFRKRIDECCNKKNVVMTKRRKIVIALGMLVVGVFVGVLVIGAVGYRLYLSKTSDEVVFAATEIGTPVGPNVSREIGPAGGTLVSPDGRLTLNVPRNALTETVAFSIQPITNKSEGGLGLAYRLGPDGKTFTTPLQLSVRYDDHDLEGTVPEALTIAYQDGKGAWHAQKSGTLDEAAKTLTVATTHFTDEACLARFRIRPAEATIYVGNDICIELIECEESGFWDKIWSRPLHCYPVKEVKQAWALRGEGRLNYECSNGVGYQAPLKKPRPNIAWVGLTADLWVWNRATGETSKEQKTFLTKITIIDRGYSASGQVGDGVFSGDICDLETTFTIKNSNPFMPSWKFVPSSPTNGTYSFVYSSLATGSGGGTYTITGTDTLKTGLELTGSATANLAGMSESRRPPIHIDLVPLDKECKPEP